MELVIKRMHLAHLIDLAFASHAANRGTLAHRVLSHIMQSYPNMSAAQLLRFLPLFQHIHVPDFLTRYLVRMIARTIHTLNPKPHRGRTVLATVFDKHAPPPLMERTFYPRHLAMVDNQQHFWNLVCRNGLADAVIIFLMHTERDSLVQIVHTIVRYIEPRRENIESIADMVSDISHMMTTRECDTLLRDMTTADNWSKRATMLVASVLLYEAKESYETQLPVTLHWAHVGAQPIVQLAHASVDGIVFAVQIHSTFDGESRVMLSCDCSETASMLQYAQIRYVAWIVDADCRCDCLHLLRRFRDGSLLSVEEDGAERLHDRMGVRCNVTLLNVSEVTNWRIKHGKDCTAQMKIRIELQRTRP
eukprot:TRINITY_DN1263_c0_g1_i2.p1 TRINITY_DN1263_c0_g1~~TRINITY_DN1263_c0_g1_i2.p1  ORF type:complete len:362 (-),score=46.48 TRINITY_DN1263_c0_g1_i2:501-1586(-)